MKIIKEVQAPLIPIINQIQELMTLILKTLQITQMKIRQNQLEKRYIKMEHASVLMQLLDNEDLQHTSRYQFKLKLNETYVNCKQIIKAVL